MSEATQTTTQTTMARPGRRSGERRPAAPSVAPSSLPGFMPGLGACLIVCLVVCLCLTACSGGEPEENDGEEQTPREETRPVKAANDGEGAAQGDDSGDDSGNGQGNSAGNNSDSEPGGAQETAGALIRRLDRLVTGTDASMLRSGLAEDAAPASLSLDALEARWESARSRRVSSSAPPEGGSR